MKITILLESETDSPVAECTPIRIALVRMFTMMRFTVKVDGLISTWNRLDAIGSPKKEDVDNAML